MEEKDVRDREWEPEEDFHFEYEDLAEGETDPGQAKRQNDVVQEELYDAKDADTVETEEFTEDEEFVVRFKPWMIPAFAGIMILAILICIPLWKLSHHDRNTENDEIAAVTTQTQTAEEPSTATSEPTTAPEITAEPVSVPASEAVTPEPVETPAEAPQTTPEAQPQPTEAPAATELPGTANQEDALAEGNSMTFGDVNETVTAKDVLNLRNTPYTGDVANVVGQLKNGETLVRTGRNDSTGWSRLEYNGQTVYAVSAYLTTDLTYKTPEKPTYPNRVSTQDGRVIVFTDCDDYITPKELINLRTEPSTSEGESTVRTQVRNGTNLHRTGYSEGSGWSRVEYNGEILYAVTNYVISGSAPE